MSLPIARIFFTVSISLLIFFTHNRNILWKDDIQLWLDISKKSPDKTRAHSNLGYAYDVKGFYDKAIEEYKKALSLEIGGTPILYTNLGAALEAKGMIDDAIMAFQKAIALNQYIMQMHIITLAASIMILGLLMQE